MSAAVETATPNEGAAPTETTNAAQSPEVIASAAEGTSTRTFGYMVEPKLTVCREATLYWESRLRDHGGRVEDLLQGVPCVSSDHAFDMLCSADRLLLASLSRSRSTHAPLVPSVTPLLTSQPHPRRSAPLQSSTDRPSSSARFLSNLRASRRLTPKVLQAVEREMTTPVDDHPCVAVAEVGDVAAVLCAVAVE